MIRKVYEVDPMICPRCGGRIIHHLKLTFATERPPPSRIFAQVALMAAERCGDYD